MRRCTIHEHRELEAENARLRSALQPFADYAAMFEHHQEGCPNFTTGVVALSDLRAARSVLGSSLPGGKK